MPNMMILLNQGALWVTRDLRRVRIADMTPGHAGNSFRLLLRARMLPVWRLRDEAVKGPCPHEDMSDGVYDAVANEEHVYLRECERRTDEEWLLTTPLGAALHERSQAPA